MVQNCEIRMLMLSIRFLKVQSVQRQDVICPQLLSSFFVCFPIPVFCICVLVMFVMFLKSQMTERGTMLPVSTRPYPQESGHVCICVFV